MQVKLVDQNQNSMTGFYVESNLNFYWLMLQSDIECIVYAWCSFFFIGAYGIIERMLETFFSLVTADYSVFFLWAEGGAWFCTFMALVAQV